MVSEYMNMLEVAAILVFPTARGCHKCWADQAQGHCQSGECIARCAELGQEEGQRKSLEVV